MKCVFFLEDHFCYLTLSSESQRVMGTCCHFDHLLA